MKIGTANKKRAQGARFLLAIHTPIDPPRAEY